MSVDTRASGSTRAVVLIVQKACMPASDAGINVELIEVLRDGKVVENVSWTIADKGKYLVLTCSSPPWGTASPRSPSSSCSSGLTTSESLPFCSRSKREPAREASPAAGAGQLRPAAPASQLASAAPFPPRSKGAAPRSSGALHLRETSIPELQRARRATQGKSNGASTTVRESPAVSTMRRALAKARLSSITVKIGKGGLQLGNIPLEDLASLARALLAVKLAK